jgi:hypothetical protein
VRVALRPARLALEARGGVGGGSCPFITGVPLQMYAVAQLVSAVWVVLS